MEKRQKTESGGQEAAARGRWSRWRSYFCKLLSQESRHVLVKMRSSPPPSTSCDDHLHSTPILFCFGSYLPFSGGFSEVRQSPADLTDGEDLVSLHPARLKTQREGTKT